MDGGGGGRERRRRGEWGIGDEDEETKGLRDQGPHLINQQRATRNIVNRIGTHRI
jgi:hypothetical protein